MTVNHININIRAILLIRAQETYVEYSVGSLLHGFLVGLFLVLSLVQTEY